MHASLEQLLSILDGELPATDVCGCGACSEVLQQLTERRHALVALPPVTAPEGGWQRLQPALTGTPETTNVSKLWTRMAASLGAVAAVLMTLSWLQGSSVNSLADGGRQPAGVTQLVEESRALEDLLAALDQRSPKVMNATRADLIASLEDRIALVDYGLSHPQHMDLSPQQSKQLWQERVSLMATLVEAHGVQFQQVDF